METVTLDPEQLEIIISIIVTVSMCISAFIGFSTGWKGE